ncbi:MAG: 50S ribosomal protein L29 [Patescibacteria group bacterium]|nr:50S ribosomal protein L29 [Patescibacteria group bacterium]
MKIAELNNKSATELRTMLSEHRTKERELRFRISTKQTKNVREIRKLKKTIARIMMVLHNKKTPAQA